MIIIYTFKYARISYFSVILKIFATACIMQVNYYKHEISFIPIFSHGLPISFFFVLFKAFVSAIWRINEPTSPKLKPLMHLTDNIHRGEAQQF